jgi:p-hydroxybenzoate 3-monooxygenase
LNLAASDVNYLWRILREYYHHGRSDLLATYSRLALDRVWKGERFSWFMTRLLHDFPQQNDSTPKCRRPIAATIWARAPG